MPFPNLDPYFQIDSSAFSCSVNQFTKLTNSFHLALCNSFHLSVAFSQISAEYLDFLLSIAYDGECPDLSRLPYRIKDDCAETQRIASGTLAACQKVWQNSGSPKTIISLLCS